MSFLNPLIDKYSNSKIFTSIVLATAVLVTLATLVWLLIRSRYGINLTDESFYLIWMSNPWIYPVSASQFGFIYHPLCLLLHGDIARLRQANILIIFGLAWLLCIVFFRATIDTRQQSLSWCSVPMLALAAVVATCSLVYFCPHGWLATPSYNSLVFQALMLASIGLLLAEKTVTPVSIVGWILIGIGGWLAFMAKPTSAAVLGFVVSVCLPLTGKFNFRLFAISVFTAIVLLITSAWVIDGSIIVFIKRLKLGADGASLLGSQYSLMELLRIDRILMGDNERQLLIFFSVLSLGAIFLTASEKKFPMMTGLVITWLFALTSLVIIAGYLLFQVEGYSLNYLVMLILIVPLSAWLFSVVLTRRLPFFKASKIQWGMTLYFIALPHVSAFGTGNNYWLQGSLSGIFWVLAGLIMLMPAVSMRGIQPILPVIVSGQLITVFLLQAAMERPYNYQPQALRQYNNIITIGVNESKLVLPQYLADYYQDVKKMADQAGFYAGMPMIDMTGESPGTLYVLGAKSIGQAWLAGGYAGSNNLAVTMLNRVSCADIAEAWLLVNPDDSPMKLSLTILDNFAIGFDQNFKMAAELNIQPINVIGWGGVPAQRLQLWKPAHSAQHTIAACEKKRNSL